MDNRELFEPFGDGIGPHRLKFWMIFIRLKLLVEWNEKINLTAITDERELSLNTFLDSLSCLKVEFLSVEENTRSGDRWRISRSTLKFMTVLLIMLCQIHCVNASIILKLVGEVLNSRVGICILESGWGSEYLAMRQQYDIVVSRAIFNRALLVVLHSLCQSGCGLFLFQQNRCL